MNAKTVAGRGSVWEDQKFRLWVFLVMNVILMISHGKGGELPDRERFSSMFVESAGIYSRYNRY